MILATNVLKKKKICLNISQVEDYKQYVNSACIGNEYK